MRTASLLHHRLDALSFKENANGCRLWQERREARHARLAEISMILNTLDRDVKRQADAHFAQRESPIQRSRPRAQV
eukprot:scaffold8226_cov286-Pinguiococcus_pyrenoidosus.AAC.1